MDEGGEKRVCGSSEVDWLSNLPEQLIIQVLLKLRTKDVVRCSALSSRWKNLWKYIPKLDLEGDDFCVPLDRLSDPDWPSKYQRCVSFVNNFLGFNSESSLESFRLAFPGDRNRDPDNPLIRQWMDIVIKRKVKHLQFLENSWESHEFQIPLTIYTCESLVSLMLWGVTLSTPEFVSLPFLKDLDLSMVKFLDALALERLISGCSVLENLYILRRSSHGIQVLRVFSQSLLSFTFSVVRNKDAVEDSLLVVDAPRLEFLKLGDHRTASFIITNPASLAKVNIDIVFNLSYPSRFNPADRPKRNMIRNFLGSISCVKDITISSRTLEVIYDYSRCEPLPLFRNLSSLLVKLTHYSWEMLPIFLESCPNLKSLVVVYSSFLEKGINIFPAPRCFLSSLEHVKIEWPLIEEAIEMVELVSYFLENSTILKKLTLCLDELRNKEESAILKELLTIPRLSTSCQVIIL